MVAIGDRMASRNVSIIRWCFRCSALRRTVRHSRHYNDDRIGGGVAHDRRNLHGRSIEEWPRRPTVNRPAPPQLSVTVEAEAILCTERETVLYAERETILYTEGETALYTEGETILYDEGETILYSRVTNDGA